MKNTTNQLLSNLEEQMRQGEKAYAELNDAMSRFASLQMKLFINPLNFFFNPFGAMQSARHPIAATTENKLLPQWGAFDFLAAPGPADGLAHLAKAYQDLVRARISFVQEAAESMGRYYESLAGCGSQGGVKLMEELNQGYYGVLKQYQAFWQEAMRYGLQQQEVSGQTNSLPDKIEKTTVSVRSKKELATL
jgi:hypothetical protein